MNCKDKLTFLFLGGAKRVAIARRFIEACRNKNLEGKIIGYELDVRCPLASVGTVLEGRKWRDPDILGHIDEVVREYDVDVILPFVDSAVGIAAAYRDTYTYRNVYIPVGARATAELMFDKCMSAELFLSLGIEIPATCHEWYENARLIAKPRFGSASKGIVIIDKQSEFEMLSGTEYLIQERIDKKQEITVDCFISVADGAIRAVSPRIRLEVSGGEVVRTMTIDDADVISLARKTIEKIGLRGAVTIQFIRDVDSGRLMVMEINPRLGGGVPASINAGADIAAMIVDEALGLRPEYKDAVPGVLTVRYLDDIAFFPKNI